MSWNTEIINLCCFNPVISDNLLCSNRKLRTQRKLKDNCDWDSSSSTGDKAPPLCPWQSIFEPHLLGVSSWRPSSSDKVLTLSYSTVQRGPLLTLKKITLLSIWSQLVVRKERQSSFSRLGFNNISVSSPIQTNSNLSINKMLSSIVTALQALDSSN